MAIIECAAVVASNRRFLKKGALQLADDAIGECLERANRSATDIDLLVNAGIYREKNLAEPALAAMIQEDIGANPEQSSDDHSHGTFSFDVANGGCGVVTAFEFVAGFIESKTIELGAVVASDSNPGGVEAFPFPNAGGAVLLRPSPLGKGFTAFTSATFPEFSGNFESAIVWHPHAHPVFSEGTNVLAVAIGDEFTLRASECSEVVVRRFVEENGLGLGDIDLLIASTYPRTFAADLAKRLAFPSDRIAVPEDRFAGAHAVGAIASLDAAIRSGQFSRARNVLFVTVGAGVTVAAALYRQPSPDRILRGA